MSTPWYPLDLAEARRSGSAGWVAEAVTRYRDLLLLRNGDLITVIACDSNAGIGDQPADLLRQPARMTGFAAAKVPLMEVLAAGAAPIVLVNNLGSARDGAGREILAGIEDCVRLSGHSPVITGSDETNIATVQSSVGVTVIGVAAKNDLLLGRAEAGDTVLVIGEPMDGIRVPYEEDNPKVVTPREVAALVAAGIAHEILPVGSRGVRYEASELARTAGLRFIEDRDSPRATRIDMTLSAGSSTCVLVASPPEKIGGLSRFVSQTITPVGRLTT